MEGVKPGAPSLDSLGVFARSVEDLQLVLDLFVRISHGSPASPPQTRAKAALVDPERSAEDPQAAMDLPALMSHETPASILLKGLKVAVVKTPMWPEAGPGTVAAMEKATSIFEKHGVLVEEVEVPSGFSDAAGLKLMHKRLFASEARVSFLQEYQLDKSKIGQEIRDLVENKEGFTQDDALEATDRFAVMRKWFDDVVGRYDAIITQSAIDEAPMGLEDMGSAAFNFLWTVTKPSHSFCRKMLTVIQALHVPVVNIPAFVGGHGMPVGISIIGRRSCDGELLRISGVLAEPLMAEDGWKLAEAPDISHRSRITHKL